MNALVGYTGFVGSNIYAEGQFDRVFNSKNIVDAYGLEPDMLIYAGMRAEKYLANNAPEKDMELVLEAEENIRRINPKKLVLISTVDVLKNPVFADENTEVDTENLHAYGYNRYQLEIWARKNYPDALIIRLPGLFGINIKKNFIYDYINLIPFMLKKEKLTELAQREPCLSDYYEFQTNGFFRLKQVSQEEQKMLRQIFCQLGFTALNFTDSRSRFQFYPLKRLWKDIQLAVQNDILLWHPATEPVSASELYNYLSGKQFVNELNGIPANYDYRSIYDTLFGGSDGYIIKKAEVMFAIKKFIEGAYHE